MNLESPNFDALFGDVLTGVTDLPRCRAARSPRIATGAPGDWHYAEEMTKGRHWPWMGMFISALCHMMLFYGFDSPKKPVRAFEQPTVTLTLIDLSKIKPEFDDDLDDAGQKPANENATEAPTIPDIAPSIVFKDAFIQAVDISTLAPAVSVTNKTLLTIPPNIRHGIGSGGAGMRDLFNMADLDRIPVALYRVPPHAPGSLIAQSSSNQVMIEFIVNKRGEVVSAEVVREPGHELGDIALKAVMRWKFRPGMKAGRVVNTRVRQAIIFSTVGDENPSR